jgi:hypothetical protein
VYKATTGNIATTDHHTRAVSPDQLLEEKRNKRIKNKKE